MKFDSYTRFLKSYLYQECMLAEVEGRPLPDPYQVPSSPTSKHSTSSDRSNLSTPKKVTHTIVFTLCPTPFIRKITVYLQLTHWLPLKRNHKIKYFKHFKGRYPQLSLSGRFTNTFSTLCTFICDYVWTFMNYELMTCSALQNVMFVDVIYSIYL